MTTKELFFALLRSALKDEPLPSSVGEYDARALFVLAKQHDLTHLITATLEKSGMLPEDAQARSAYEKEQMAAILREVRLSEMTGKVKTAFDENGIPYVLLKGAVIRPLYPAPWMRTSCDADVLIHEEDLDKAVALLTDAGFTTKGERNFHDVSLYYGYTHLELHFNICENDEKLDRMLSKVWDYTLPGENGEHRMTSAFFLFHHTAHAAYHFIRGGCGVKPLLDLYVLRQCGFYDEDELLPLLEQSDLVTFYKAMCALCAYWFEDGKPDGVTEEMERYILEGGVYGNKQNSASAGAAKSGGKFRYLWRKAFPPMTYMRNLYPVLDRHPILLPFCYCRRFFKKVFGKSGKRIRNDVRVLKNQNGADNSVNALLEKLGLL